MQPGGRRADRERVGAVAAEHAGRGEGVGAIDVEPVVPAAERDVDRFDGAGHRLGPVEGLAGGVVDRPRPRRVGRVVAGPEAVVVDADESVGPQAHAGHGDRAQLPRGGGGVAGHVERVEPALARERHNAADAPEFPGVVADVERVVARPADDRGEDRGGQVLDPHHVVEAAQLDLEGGPRHGGVRDAARQAEAGDGVTGEGAGQPGGGRVGAQVDAVHRAAVAASARIDHKPAEPAEVAAEAVERVAGVVVRAAGGEEGHVGVARQVEAVGTRVALQSRRAGHRLDEDAVAAAVAADQRRSAGVDPVGVGELQEVEVRAAGDFDGGGRHVAANFDGGALVGVGVGRLRVAADQHRDPARHQPGFGHRHVVAGKQLDGAGGRDQPAGQQDDVLVVPRRVVRGQPDVARPGDDPLDVEGPAHPRDVDAGRRVDEQPADARHGRVELQRALLLADAGPVNLDGVGGRADPAAVGGQRDVGPLDVRAGVGGGVKDGAAAGNQHHVAEAGHHAAEVQVALSLGQEDSPVGRDVHGAGGLRGRVDLQSV